MSCAYAAGSYATFTYGTASATASTNNFNSVFAYNSINKYQTFTVPCNGTYQVELWGAQGGRFYATPNYTKQSGGGYVSGESFLNKSSQFFLYIGQDNSTYDGSSYNGAPGSNGSGHAGGGASDMRLTSGSWDNANSLNSRVIVAAGGGAGGASWTGYAGGLIGYSSYSGGSKTGGTQTSAGRDNDFSCIDGYNATNKFGIAAPCGATGGGGYYAGSGGAHATGGGAGGSSYISGHTGCVAIASGSTTEPRAVRYSGCTTGTTNNTCSIHYSGISFTKTLMIDGAGYKWTTAKGSLQAMPSATSKGSYYSSGAGHSGNGYARITLVSIN